MIRTITSDDADDYADLIRSMYRLRKVTFQDRLGWDVVSVGDYEIDTFDSADPVYILATSSDGTLTGCIRLLPTSGPSMLRDVFPFLVDEPGVPYDDKVWEASRFAIAPQALRDEAGLAVATYEVVTGAITFCLSQGISAVVCVLYPQMERVLRRIGCTLQRLGKAQQIGNTTTFAARIDISEQLFRSVIQQANRSKLVTVSCQCLPSDIVASR